MIQPTSSNLETRKQELWERVLKHRGFGFGADKVLAEADWEFAQKLEEWIAFVYLSDRYINRREKELIIIGIVSVLRSPPEVIHAHISAAVAAGATKEEIITIVEFVGQWAGIVARDNSLEAWRRAFAPHMPAGIELTLRSDFKDNPDSGIPSTELVSAHAVSADNNTNLDGEKEEMAKQVHNARGFRFGLHAILAEADWEYMKRFEEWVEFVYLSARHLDRRLKELIITGMVGALRSAPEHIKAHIDAGVNAGSTKEEIILVAELVGLWAGAVARADLVEAWRRTFAPDLPPVFRPQDAK